MSEPTYRITASFNPDPRWPNVPWDAAAVRISDGERVARASGSTADKAIARVREALAVMTQPDQDDVQAWANEDGSEADPPAPASLRAVPDADAPAPTSEGGSHDAA